MRPVSIVVALAAACTGPSLHVDNPSRHDVFVDGVATPAAVVPFRYYGTFAIDTLPADRADGKPDWDHRATRALVPVPAPVSGWLFPLDFPLELADRLLHGRRDRTVPVAVDRAAAAGEQLTAEALAATAARAHAARVSR